MLRLLAVCGLLTIALSMVESEFDFGGDDESVYESLLREQGFSDEDIEAFLQDDRDSKEDLNDDDDEEYVSWEEAKGYDECEEFMWWRKKYGTGKEDDWADKKKQWHENSVQDDDVKEGDVVDEYKYDGSDRRGHYKHRPRRHHKHHGKGGYHGKKKGKGCPKPKPLHAICAEYECPPFEKLNTSGCGFEARKVLSANWVVTPIDVSDMRRGYKEAFWRLFKYINGANDQEARIDMTVPVINRWFLDDDYQVAGAQMAFYISSDFQDDPPTPTDSLVTVDRWEDAITYDRAFGGDRDDPEYYKKQFIYLWKALKKEGITAFPKMSITAGYTRPGWGRQRKEVMLVDNDSM